MSTSYYQSELDTFGVTYKTAISTDVGRLKNAIAGASESGIIGVGSGGSFTVASLLCNLHETYTGHISRPSTPLEIICNPTLAASSPVFLISAEGKNPDIIEALQRARRHSARTVHLLTNHTDSPLMASVQALTGVSTHLFEIAAKDGYLATNSLLFDAIVVARAYGELDGQPHHLPSAIGDLQVGDADVAKWKDETNRFAEAAVKRGGILVIYSPLVRPIATDLESKLSEAALLHCQLADFRSFAHGRHLWLADRPNDIAVVALTEPSLGNLWSTMECLIPRSIPRLEIRLGGSAPRDLIAGLIAEMNIVATIAQQIGKDPGRPVVPQFSRDL